MNYNLILYGKNEFYNNISNKQYNILIILDDNKEKFMNDIITQKVNDNNIIYIGIDFEFNKISRTDRDVSLMQINIEDNTNIGHIFVLDPRRLKNKNVLINLLTSDKTIKVLHGSESLDIPYLFNKFLITRDNINLFCKNFYDTKYLCDYKNNIQSHKTKTKCGIYDMLLNNNIISKNKFDELEKMSNKIGPLYNIHIEINKLLDKQYLIFLYSLYDVIYLPELIKVFINKGAIYKHIIPEISSVVFKHKRNVDNNFIILEKLVEKYDNNIIIIDNNKVRLKELWEILFYYVSDDNNYIYYLKDIDYFKKFFVTITKLLIYNNINDKQIINSKNIKWIKQYKYLYSLLKNYNNNIKYLRKY